MAETLFGNKYNGLIRQERSKEVMEINNVGDVIVNQVGSSEKLKRLKVCAYCRVSTEEEMQMNSLENQILHYTNYIRTNPEWIFAGIYSDKGKSGTQTNSRSGFTKMVRHALDGHIDLIICKSISRFSRNVIDTLHVIRLLKENGVSVLFEKEAMNSSDMQSEFVLTLLAATAQDESRMISENLTWAHQRRFSSGQPLFSRIIGYKKENGKEWVVDENEAIIVRESFRLFVEGHSLNDIAKEFRNKALKKANGKTDWSTDNIRSMISNERYSGDALCQKTYTCDHLTHRVKINNGERPKYLIKDHHEAIVDRETFDRAQEKLIKKTESQQYKKTYDFSGRIICGNCGSLYHRFQSDGKVVWRCYNRTKDKALCEMDGINENDIRNTIITEFDKKFEINGSGQGKRQIIRLLKDLRNLEIIRTSEENWLKLSLENALIKENAAIINSDKNENKLKEFRFDIESQIEKKQKQWKIIDDDAVYREHAIKILNELQNMVWPKTALNKAIRKTKFFRAWVAKIIVLPNEKIQIVWSNGEISEREIVKERR